MLPECTDQQMGMPCAHANDPIPSHAAATSLALALDPSTIACASATPAFAGAFSTALAISSVPS